MKTLGVIMVFLAFHLMGCVYHCESNSRPHCADLVPPAAGAPCNERHERWFYSWNSNQCEKIAYWGCSGYGFGSKDDCEECRCHY